MTGSEVWLQDVKTLWYWLKPKRRIQLGILMGISAIGAIAEMATLGALLPFLTVLSKPEKAISFPLIGPLIEGFTRTNTSRSLFWVTLVFGLVVWAAAVLRLILAWATARYSQAIGHDLAVRVFERTLRQPYRFYISHNTSEIVAGVEKVTSVVNGVLNPALDLFVSGIMATAILCGLLLINWAMAISAGVLFGIIYWTIGSLSRRKLTQNSRLIGTSATERVKGIQEGLGGIRDILLDGSQQIHISRFDDADHTFRSAIARNALWSQAPRYLVEALGTGIIAGLAVVSATSSGGIDNALPLLGALALGAQKLLPLFQRIYSGWSSVVGSRAILEDVAKLANAPIPQNEHEKGDTSKLQFKKELKLKQVGFRYETGDSWVFKNLDLHVPKGARIGIVGETGCGKSTLLDLIMGLLPPAEGALEVDGVTLNPQNVKHWQARIAHVPQSIFLSDASIEANIAFGEHPNKIDSARVQAAAQNANIHGFIQTLVEGYQTKVGERGIRLSGGQRQRIGIARALYRKAEVIVLDEATSALDQRTEATVMESINMLGPEITVLIVAHRLTTLESCDFVLRMESYSQQQKN